MLVMHRADAAKQLAGMPALEQLALPLAEVAAEHPAARDQVRDNQWHV